MNKVKFINKSRFSKCWHCDGTGIEPIKNTIENSKCNICKGTGKWKEDFYHLIYTDKNGQKIAFGVDGLK